MQATVRELTCGVCGRPALFVVLSPGVGYRVESAPFLPEDVTRYYCARHMPPRAGA